MTVKTDQVQQIVPGAGDRIYRDDPERREPDEIIEAEIRKCNRDRKAYWKTLPPSLQKSTSSFVGEGITDHMSEPRPICAGFADAISIEGFLRDGPDIVSVDIIRDRVFIGRRKGE